LNSVRNIKRPGLWLGAFLFFRGGLSGDSLENDAWNARALIHRFGSKREPTPAERFDIQAAVIPTPPERAKLPSRRLAGLGQARHEFRLKVLKVLAMEIVRL
jgi:hypothetical protein